MLLTAAVWLTSGWLLAGPASSETAVQRWNSRLADIDALLLEREWTKAERQTRRLQKEMYSSIVSGGAEIADLTPPQRTRMVEPKFPEARLLSGRTVRVVVEFVVDVDGRPHHPKVLDSSGEFTMVLSTLEAIGEWRYRPALRQGEPIRAVMRQAVNFQVR